MTLNQAIDRSQAVRDGEALDVPALEQYLREILPEQEGPVQVEQFPSGFSNLTYLIRVGGRGLVLRRPPFGNRVKSAHDMGREHRVLSALARVWTMAPRPLAYCDDEAVLGVPFYLMERVEGVILRGKAPPGVRLTPDRMKALSTELIDILAALHGIDAVAVGLGDLGRAEGYIGRQVQGWRDRYEKARTDDSPDLAPVAAWLDQHQPQDGPAAIIHNDFKYDNVVLDAQRCERIVAVLDWEMATLGDPWMDLGTSLAYWAEAADLPALRAFGVTALPGNLDRRELVERYGEQTGRAVVQPLFYFVYGLFKIAGIVQQIYARYRRGATQDPRFANLIHLVKAFGRTAERAIERDRIERLF